MRYLTGSLLQTWPAENRRTGSVVWAEVNADGTYTLFDRDNVAFYATAVKDVHFKVIAPRARTTKTSANPINTSYRLPLNGQQG